MREDLPAGEQLHFATLWEAIADEIPSALALTHGTRMIAWGEFEQRAARLAGALRAHGLGPGSVVACYLYNCPEYFETFLAALKIRAVPANVNYRYGGAELRALLENCEAEALFFDSALRERVASIRREVPWVRLLVEVGESANGVRWPGARGYSELIASSEPAPRVSRSEQDVFLSYTGGTTGLPKGVRYTIGRGVTNSLRLRELFLGTSTELGVVDYAAEQARNGNRLVAIPASPLMHSTGFTFASLPTLTSGGQVTTLEGRSFDARELLATIGAVRAQIVAIVGDAFALPLLRALDAGAPTGRYENLVAADHLLGGHRVERPHQAAPARAPAASCPPRLLRVNRRGHLRLPADSAGRGGLHRQLRGGAWSAGDRPGSAGAAPRGGRPAGRPDPRVGLPQGPAAKRRHLLHHRRRASRCAR